MTPVLAILFTLVASPLLAQLPRPDDRTVVAGNRTWWLSCAGTGEPVVVLESGHNEPSATWREVQRRVATFTRVCAYDRAGLGRSAKSPTGGGRTGREVVKDLRSLLKASGEPGPRVMVGHSLGGAFVRLYAAAHPDDVVGLVLIDAVHERELIAINALLSPAQRAAGAKMRPLSPEGIDIDKVMGQLAKARMPTKLPLVVVARGRPLANNEMPPDWTTDQRQRREGLRRALQQELSRLSEMGTLVVAEKSGHFVHHDEPDVVVAAIRKLVDQARQPKRR